MDLIPTEEGFSVRLEPQGHGFGLIFLLQQTPFSVTRGKRAQRFPSLGLNVDRDNPHDQ